MYTTIGSTGERKCSAAITPRAAHFESDAEHDPKNVNCRFATVAIFYSSLLEIHRCKDDAVARTF